MARVAAYNNLIKVKYKVMPRSEVPVWYRLQQVTGCRWESALTDEEIQAGNKPKKKKKEKA